MNAKSLAARRLEEHLSSGGLRPGDRLLPERQLTALLGISRRALREVLAEMELEGRIWRGVGQGTFLGTRPEGRPASLAPQATASHPLAIMEARLTLEPSLAALAAVKATPDDLDLIARNARRGAETRDGESWGRWDTAFHRGIAQACHNPLLLTAFEQIEASRALTDWGELRAAITTAAMRDQSALQHQAIAAAIAGRNSALARQAMWQHLHSVNQAVQSLGAGFGKGMTQPAAKAATAHDTLSHPAPADPEDTCP